MTTIIQQSHPNQPQPLQPTLKIRWFIFFEPLENFGIGHWMHVGLSGELNNFNSEISLNGELVGSLMFGLKHRNYCDLLWQWQTTTHGSYPPNCLFKSPNKLSWLKFPLNSSLKPSWVYYHINRLNMSTSYALVRNVGLWSFHRGIVKLLGQGLAISLGMT